MFSLYGNQYEAREEHLLLKMFELALQMEFDETDDFNNLMRANTAISRMITAYTRRGPGQEYLKETLQQLVEDTNSRTDINLEVNPVKVSIDQLLDGGAYEVLNYRITVDFFENYRNTVIKFLSKYRHCSIFYQKLYFRVTVA